MAFYSLILIMALYIVSISGCKKNDASNAPVLPPSVSMDMEGLKTFGSKKKSVNITNDSTNFMMAWTPVHKWDSISAKIILVPKLIFIEALKDKDPVYNNESEEWTWTYTKDIIGNGSYLAILTGKVSNDSVYWTMTVSLIGGDGISNFKWYEGQTDLKQTGGWWKLYEPISQKAYLFINWSKKSEAARWIQYTNIFDTAPDKGSYIKYGINNSIDYNAYFNIYCSCPVNTAKIDWNTTTYVGRIIYSGWIFGWDTNLQSLHPVQAHD